MASVVILIGSSKMDDEVWNEVFGTLEWWMNVEYDWE